MTLLLGFKRGF